MAKQNSFHKKEWLPLKAINRPFEKPAGMQKEQKISTLSRGLTFVSTAISHVLLQLLYHRQLIFNSYHLIFNHYLNSVTTLVYTVHESVLHLIFEVTTENSITQSFEIRN